MLTIWPRRSAKASKDIGPAAESRDGVVQVSVSEGLADLVVQLGSQLGPSYALNVGPPHGDGVALLPAQGVPAIAYWRCKCPSAILIVVGSQWRSTAGGAAEYLDAGADGFMLDPGAQLIAAHIAAATRTARERLAARQPAV
jgi:hypothetical protein